MRSYRARTSRVVLAFRILPLQQTPTNTLHFKLQPLHPPRRTKLLHSYTSNPNPKTRPYTKMDHDFSTESVARREAQRTGEESLSPLEQEVLDEYAKLVGNLDDVCPPLPPFHPRFVIDYDCWELVGGTSSRTSSEPFSRNSGFTTGFGEEDDDGVYVVEGECV